MSYTAPRPQPAHGRPGWRTSSKLLLLALLICAVAVACLVTAQPDPARLPDTPPPPPAGVPSGVDASTWTPVPHRPVQVAEAAGPLATFGEGTYDVGTGTGQVAPGRYRSANPDGQTCYWARLRTGDGEQGDIIANGLDGGPSVFVVKTSDGLIQVRGCTYSKVR